MIKIKIIAFANQKGGTGKTTSVLNIGAGLQKLKQKVLLIDLDPQANLTTSLGLEESENIVNLLKGKIKLGDVVVDRNGLKVIPSSIELSGIEFELSNEPGREYLLKEAIEPYVNQFDYILIDCPPSLGLLTMNALTFAKEIFIILQTQFLAFNGLTKLLDTIDLIRKRLNNELELSGIICTLFDKRKKLNIEVLEKIQGHFKDKVFKTLIRENVSLAESPSFGKTILEYKLDSYGASDYLALSKEILRQNNRKAEKKNTSKTVRQKKEG